VKYIANSPAKNINSEPRKRIMPTLASGTRPGLRADRALAADDELMTA
jgi:hypothetical protein